MAGKYYVVWVGRRTGIFADWTTCKAQVDKFTGARYKSFKTQQEAEAAFAKNSGRAATLSQSVGTPQTRKSRAGRLKTYTQAEIDTIRVDTKIFTDGACEPNPGEAGTGMAIYRDDVVSELWFGMYVAKGTNNIAELHGLHQAMLKAQDELRNERSVAIFSDSAYSIQCLTQWAAGWAKKGWTRKGGEIRNLELIRPMFALHQSLNGTVPIHHVNGHVGVEGNELADRMSTLAIRSKDEGFNQYQEPIDVAKLVAMPSG